MSTRRKSATTNQAPRKQKPSYADKPHTHVLAPQRGNYRTIRCTLRGCKYAEYWDGSAFRPYGPAARGLPDNTASRKRIEAEQRDAIRPHNLWGGLPL